jgi:hypothetical protein
MPTEMPANPFTIYHLPFTIDHSPFTIHHSTFTIASVLPERRFDATADA